MHLVTLDVLPPEGIILTTWFFSNSKKAVETVSTRDLADLDGVIERISIKNVV